MRNGEKVAALMAERGWKLADLAEEVRKQGARKVKYQHIQQLLAHPDRRPQYIMELAAAFGMTVEEFAAWAPAGSGAKRAEKAVEKLRPIVTWDDPEELDPEAYAVVPRVRVKFSAGRGGPQWSPDPDMALGQAYRVSFLTREKLRGKNLMSALVSGDSMEPRIQDGDSILIDTSSRDIRDGHVYALAWDEELRTKRLFRTPSGGLLIKSDNADKYPQFEIAPERLDTVLIIGRVIHVSGKI